MSIHSTGGRIHWNYFLALERDLETVSRFVEFSPRNFTTYSIALAHLLLAAASEVDVVAKLLCVQSAPGAPSENIDQYRAALLPTFPELPGLRVQVQRYGLSFAPWENWAQGVNPNWWQSYNNVKHMRDAHFDEATLQNALNALGALLIVVHRYYRAELAGPAGTLLGVKDTSLQLTPTSSLVRLPDDHYYEGVYY